MLLCYGMGCSSGAFQSEIESSIRLFVLDWHGIGGNGFYYRASEFKIEGALGGRFISVFHRAVRGSCAGAFECEVEGAIGNVPDGAFKVKVEGAVGCSTDGGSIDRGNTDGGRTVGAFELKIEIAHGCSPAGVVTVGGFGIELLCYSRALALGFQVLYWRR